MKTPFTLFRFLLPCLMFFCQLLQADTPPAPPQRAVALPITQEHCLAALWVERLALKDGKSTGGKETAPRFRYTIRSVTWEGGQRELRSFCSRHCYGQGYACGDTLVLTNSGMPGEGVMSLAVIDHMKAQVLEDELLFDARELCAAIESTCHWSGADANGRRCGGSYTTLVWHQTTNKPSTCGWDGFVNAIYLYLGGQIPNRCGICWVYDKQSGSSRLEPLSKARENTPLPHQSRHLPIVVDALSSPQP